MRSVASCPQGRSDLLGSTSQVFGGEYTIIRPCANTHVIKRAHYRGTLPLMQANGIGHSHRTAGPLHDDGPERLNAGRIVDRGCNRRRAPGGRTYVRSRMDQQRAIRCRIRIAEPQHQFRLIQQCARACDADPLYRIIGRVDQTGRVH